MSGVSNGRWLRANRFADIASDARDFDLASDFRNIPLVVQWAWSEMWLREGYAVAASLELDGAACGDLP